MAKRSRKKRARNPAASFPDDLIVEILSRLPVRSLCRFKCVSRHWRDLISHPDHRGKLPETLFGVFYFTFDRTRFPEQARHFTDVWDSRLRRLICPSLSFVPGYERITRVLDSCNGLLLCVLSSSDKSFRYMVCNPATQSWVVLPDSGCGSDLDFRITRLGFDPAVSLHFYVFEFISDESCGYVEGVQIYSCKTGAWSYKESEWDYDAGLNQDSRSIFFSGSLHLVIAECAILAVDVEGETWRVLPVPEDVDDTLEWEEGFLGQYQGHLCYINECDYESDLSIWVLEDYTTDQWILKHHVSIQKLCEKRLRPYGIESYHVITVHPDCNLILYSAGAENTLMAYDIDRKEAYAIRKLGRKCWLPCIPYIPLYSESLTHGH
ncbi:hypothetical protein ACP4OV_007639 [Aristida adscensionis]